MKKRWRGWIAIAIGVILLLIIITAPGGNELRRGSTYNRAPDGYGAWYAFMGQSVQRWQKPFSDLANRQETPVTLLRINPKVGQFGVTNREQNWVEKGNVLVVLGVSETVTDAKFSTIQESPVGGVKIETKRRRSPGALGFSQLPKKGEKREIKRLGDRFGTIVWEEKLGKGKLIYSITPDLAANAYQDEFGNFKFLSQLVTTTKKIWVDEYIHGYKDKDIVESEGAKDLFTYLIKTPVFPILVQIAAILLILILGKNRRFGTPISLPSPKINNSEAYIQALAVVLQKAKTYSFVLQTVGKELQLQLQQKLGLGTAKIEQQTLIDTWIQKTGATAAELEQVLSVQNSNRRLNESDLLNWLKKWQTIQSKATKNE